MIYGNEGRNDTLIGGDGLDPLTGLPFNDQVIYLGRESRDFVINVNDQGIGTVRENFLINPNDDPITGARALGAIDSLTGIEEIVFDDGVLSTKNQNVATKKWIPLVNVTNSVALELNDGVLDIRATRSGMSLSLTAISSTIRPSTSSTTDVPL